MQNVLGEAEGCLLPFGSLYSFPYFIKDSFPRGWIFTVPLACVSYRMVCGLCAGSVPLFPACHVQGVALGTCPGGSWYPGKVMEMGRLLLRGHLDLGIFQPAR